MATASIRDNRQTDQFVATNGQTVFTLSETPVDPADVVMVVDGSPQREGDDYTTSGTTLTWLNNDFALAAGDKVEISYGI